MLTFGAGSFRTARGAAIVLCALVALRVAAAESVSTDLLERIAPHAAASALVRRSPIRVRGGGAMPLDFAAAARLLAADDLLERIQAAYAQTLPAGTKPEFSVRAEGGRAWSFVNRHGQSSRIEEVARAFDADGGVGARLIYYVRGERFFGAFESVTVIGATPDSNGGIRYELDVFAYPHGAVVRFFVRRLGLVEKFFREKTDEIEKRTLLLGGLMLQRGEAAARPDAPGMAAAGP